MSSDLVGIDWNDLFGGVHEAGSVLLKAFGAGAVVPQLEKLESPILPDWAKSQPSTSAPAPGVVKSPDFVVLVSTDASKKPAVVLNPVAVNITGGTRFDGDPSYKKGDKDKFSFGYNAPPLVEIVSSDGKKATVTDAKQVLFGGGTESTTKVHGDELVGLGEGINWWTLLDPTGFAFSRELYNAAQGPGATYNHFAQSFSNPYQKSAIQQQALTAAQQHAAAGQALQQQLRAQQAANISSMLSQVKPMATPTAIPAVIPPAAGLSLAPPPIPDLSQPQQDTSTSTDQGPPPFDPYNPYATTDQSVQGMERSRSMSDEIEVLGEQVEREMRDLGRAHPAANNDTDLDSILNELGIPGAPSAAVVGAYGSVGVPVPKGRAGDVDTSATKSYLFGCDVLGAPVIPRASAAHPLAPKMGITIKTSPKTGRQFTSLTINKNKLRFSPQKTLTAARTVAARAKQAAAAAQTALSKVKPATKVKGAVSMKGTPKMTLAAAKALALKTTKDAAELAKHADKYAGSLKTYANAQKASEKRGAAATKLHGAVDVLGDDGDYGFAAFEEIVGQFIVGSLDLVGDYIDDNGILQPGNDPNANQYGGSNGAPPPSGYPLPSPTGLPTDTASQLPGPPDYGAGPAPTMDSLKAGLTPGLDYVPDPGPESDTHFYTYADFQNIPNAVVYDGSQQPPFQGMGNFTVFEGMLPNSAPPKGGPNSGYSWHGSGGFDWALELMGTQPSTGYSGGHNFDKVSDPGFAMVAESGKNNWGPLMGNPNGGWTRGLRFVPDGPNGPFWFWYFDTAMQVAPWATQSVLQAMLNDQVTAYKAAVLAGQTDYLNAVLQDQLSAQQAQQLAQQQAVVDAQVAQQQEVAQEQEAEQQAQLAAQQQQLDLQNYQQQMAQQAQQNQIDLQLQQQQAAYFAAHPDQMFVPVDQGAPQDQGGGGDGSDDMTPMNLDDSQIDWGGA